MAACPEGAGRLNLPAAVGGPPLLRSSAARHGETCQCHRQQGTGCRLWHVVRRWLCGGRDPQGREIERCAVERGLTEQAQARALQRKGEGCRPGSERGENGTR